MEFASAPNCASLRLVPNTPRAVAQALQTLLADGPLRQRLGQAARERYEAQFQPEAMAEPVLSLYQQAPLMHTARWPMTRPRRQTQQLASQQANRQSAHLVWSLLGLAMIGLAYAISQALTRDCGTPYCSACSRPVQTW